VVMKSQRIITGSLALLLTLFLAACGPAAPAGPETPVEATPGEVIPRALPEEQVEQVRNAAIAHLSTTTGIAQDAITVVSIEEREWPSSALGCPQPGMMYLEVITPGYLITLEAQGETFNVHTDAEGANVIVCEEDVEARGDQPEARPTPTPVEGEGATMDPVATRALQHLSAETGIQQDAMTIVSREEREWPSSALGCPQPGMMYLDVITPGFLLVVEAEGEQYNLHSDVEGNNIIICDNPQSGRSIDR
jgi:hypothetical protein